jgi:hypothetical protein
MPGESAVDKHRTGKWVGPRAGLDPVENTKILFPFPESNDDSSVVQRLVTILTTVQWTTVTMFLFPLRGSSPSGAKASSLPRLRDHTRQDSSGQVVSSVWRPLLKTHNTYKRQIPFPPAAFEPTIPVNERPQIHALDRAATGIDSQFLT